MGYTDNQAQSIANQIYRRFGYRIHLACQSSKVEESFLVGFIGVEAGKDRTGQIVENATRFEPGVYQKLLALRDGLRSTYQGISHSEIKDASDASIKALSFSYQLTQIMGWHVVKNLKCSLADLRNPELHLHFAVELLEIVGGKYLIRRDYPSVLRIWNTGSANGKTYHADYVENALKVAKYYGLILKQNKGKNLSAPLQNEFVAYESAPVFETLPPAGGNEERSSTPLAENPSENSTQTIVKTENVTVKNESSGSTAKDTPDDSSDKFSAFIPQIDTAKTWLQRLFAGLSFGSAGAYFFGLPVWIQIFFAVMISIVVVGGIVVFVKYHKEIFAYVTNMNTLRATPGLDNPQLTTDKGE